MAPAVEGAAALDAGRIRTRRWRASDVELGAIVGKLHELQAELARHDVAQQEHPHPRNCVLNLVVVLGDHHRAEACDRLVAGLAASHPLRAILVHPGGGQGRGVLDAEIVSEAHQLVNGFPVQREQILLHVRGEAAVHLASLVEPLLVSDVPTYLWWSGRHILDADAVRDVMSFSDVVVVDSALVEDPVDVLRRLAGLAEDRRSGVGVADLRWGRMRPWRDAIAQAFAPGGRRSLLAGLREIRVETAGTGPGSRVGAALLAGWMAGALGWRFRDVTGDDGATRATAEADGRQTAIELRSVTNERLRHGELLTVRIAGRAGGRALTLTVERDPDGDRHAHVTMELGGGAPVRQRLALPWLGDPDLLVHVLWSGVRDPVFERALVSSLPLLEPAR
jgi:glucose-6-phosphate dehydrogenase assembly protein OpcA